MNACLLHHAYHALEFDCWAYRLAWMNERHRVPDEWREEFYQQAVESAILGDVWKVGHLEWSN